MDNELVAAIEKYHADKDKNAEIARKMKEAREAKKAAKATPAPQPATPLVEKPTEVVPPVEETPRPAETTTEETPPVETKEEGGEVDGKKSSGIGTFLTVALAVGLGFLGFTAWKNNQ